MLQSEESLLRTRMYLTVLLLVHLGVHHDSSMDTCPPPTDHGHLFSDPWREQIKPDDSDPSPPHA